MLERLLVRSSSSRPDGHPLAVVIAALLWGLLCLNPDSVHAVGNASVSFELDIQPILTAKGCNSGPCHGKQRGQNGFQLSLLGFDSDFDYDALVRQSRGRRLAMAAPEQSLLLKKASAEVPHGGGRKIELGSRDYHLLTDWIRQGALRRVENEPTLTSVELVQDDFSLKTNEHAELRVIAYYSDSTTRDVTDQTTYLSNDDAVVAVDESGKMTANSLPGETAVMARYQNHICVANVTIPQTNALPPGLFDSLPRNNFVDDLVYRKLQVSGIRPSDPCDDSTFMRRVYTDIIGRIPSPDDAKEFLDSPATDKREQLVDHLLGRREYVDHWANQWADLLRPNPYRVGIKAVLNYDNWIRQQFRDDVSHAQFARRLITAKGSTWRNGAVTLYRDRRSPDEIATLVSQLFLGVRLECAKCHHHPFEKWSQRDFYQFAAFFGRVKRKGTGLSPPISGGEEFVLTSDSGTVMHPGTGEVMEPTPLFGSAEIAEGSDPRDALADWITSDDNPYFAAVHANRIWAHMMGRGLVDPVDDLRSTNPPTNSELLRALATGFQENGYDQKWLIKTIALSNVYSLSSIPNDSNTSDRLNYSRHYRHRLRGEVLMDAIADITETSFSLSAMAPESNSHQIWTHRIDSVFLDTFGRPNENQDPPCERISDSSVTQTLHLMNSKTLSGRIRSDESRAARLAKSELTANQIVEELYLAIFARRPSGEERSYAEKLILTGGDDRRAVIEDLMWAMLNAPEFTIQN